MLFDNNFIRAIIVNGYHAVRYFDKINYCIYLKHWAVCTALTVHAQYVHFLLLLLIRTFIYSKLTILWWTVVQYVLPLQAKYLDFFPEWRNPVY